MDSRSGPPDSLKSDHTQSARPIQAETRLGGEQATTIAQLAAAAADEVVEDEFENEMNAVDEAAALAGLTENVRDQDELERDITNHANKAMIEQEDDRDRKRIAKVESSIEKLETQKRTIKRRLEGSSNNTFVRNQSLVDLERIGTDIAALRKDIADIENRIAQRHQHDGEENQDDDGINPNKRMPNESQRDFLIRTGKITPFSRLPERGPEGHNRDLTEALMDAEEEAELDGMGAQEVEHRSHQNLRLPGFAEASESRVTTPESESNLPRKKRKVANGTASIARISTDDDNFTPNISDGDSSEGEWDGDRKNTQTKSKKRFLNESKDEDKVDLTGIDDGNEKMYQARLKKWVDRRRAARNRISQQDHSSQDEQFPDDADADADADGEECFQPCPGVSDHQFENGVRMPGDIYPALFDYQKTGVQWLGELYAQQVGGIVGDEMGLGKTIQVISFTAALHYSKKLTKPIIIVAPATVLRQWVNEFHKWWPPMRVSILHSSGSGMMNIRNEGRLEEAAEKLGRDKSVQKKSSKWAKKIVDRVVQHGHVLVTTYAGLQTYADLLVPVDWGYAVLDEGHKIRNPNTAITIYCKELRTPNRIILSGTPMQNNLVELWSLFDFVFPMRLGTLVNFRQAFEVPIKQGGYANSTNLQVLTAQKCAETLKATISPYLLQRLKVDVAADLPKKTEQVLFCKLTKPQREAYETFLASDDMVSILNRQRQSLYGIDILRKICNHPDLLDPALKKKPGYKWGNPNKSGKMQVVKALLQMWKGFGHKTLLFSQGVQMLNVLENFVKDLGGLNYLRMDGATSVKERQTLVDRFNNDPDQHVFLLSTKVGGLGVNLTGASRVIIFDPDWNPSTDMQARERAWRLGQKKEVVIYRLMTAGTIEEKIYHRQIYKQFLSNKVLKDPTQRQTFQMKDLEDLFTLGNREDGTTETGELFRGTEVQFNKTPEPAVLTNQISIHGSKQNSPGLSNVRSPEALHLDGENQQLGDVDAGVRDLIGVAGLEAFRNEEEEKPTSEESRLMEGIFARAGVHSALEHDQIINGKKKLAGDRGMLEREARKVAAEAAAELRKAGEVARNIAPGTVTWTGEFGSAGRPGNIRRGNGPSSAGILASLSSRQGISTAGSAASSRSGTPGAASGSRTYQGRDWAKLIQEFIRQQGGSVPSQVLVNHFGRLTRTPNQIASFKAALPEIANCSQGNSRMRAHWSLKDEYK